MMNAARDARAKSDSEGNFFARAFRQFAALLAIALIPALISAIAQLKFREPAVPAAEVTPGTVKAWGGKVLWVDSGIRAQFEHGHVEGALLLNEPEWDRLLPAFFDEWRPEREVVVYCEEEGCDAADRVARRLRDELGLKNIHVLKGGVSGGRIR